MLIENIVIEQFEVIDEGGNNIDKEKDKDNFDIGCFIRLRLKGLFIFDGLVMV